jgi:deglycase
MTSKNLQGVRVAILATSGVEQSEVTEPRKVLEEAGAETTLIAPKRGKIQAMDHDEEAVQFDVDLTFDEVNPSRFDAVLLPGGVLNADALRAEPRAKEFVRRMDEAGKPIGVISHGTWLLVSTGLTRGRTLTSYHSIQDDIRNAGGRWVDKEVVRDHNWVSSRGPSDLPAFNRAIVALFGERWLIRELPIAMGGIIPVSSPTPASRQ